MTLSHSLYFTAPRQVAVRQEELPHPSARQVLVKTLLSAISPGTEAMIYRGQFPEIPPGDATALAQCLAGLANDRRRLAELSLAAWRRYPAHPTWEQTAARLREFLGALAHS